VASPAGWHAGRGWRDFTCRPPRMVMISNLTMTNDT